MGYLYRPKLRSGKLSGKWWVKYYVNGRPVRESTGTEKESEARRFLKLKEGAVAKGSPIAPRLDRILYDELAGDLRQDYRTTGRRHLDEVEQRLAHLDKFFRGRRAANIGPTFVTTYVAQRQERGVSNRTINIELSLLKRMLRLAHENGKLLRVPPVKMLKEAPPRQGFFEEEQYRAVRRRLPEDLQVAVAIAYTFGWRIKSEVLTLQRRQVDLKTGTLRLDPGTTKNGEGRVVYLTPDLRSLLTQQLERVDRIAKQTGRIISWVFPHLTGRFQGERIKDFRKAWTTACKRAGLPWMLVHDFRRTAVRNMERAGVPRSVAMKLTGHKTESVYRRYAIVSDADLQDATRKLTGTFSGTSGKVGVDSHQINVQNHACDPLAQLAEHLPFKQGAAGSNPARVTNLIGSTTSSRTLTKSSYPSGQLL